MVAAALTQLKGRIVIEVIFGEIMQTLEQIRYGLVDHRNGLTEAAQPSQEAWPQLYDRIHLSKIPDYIGGPLSKNLYAVPVLTPGPGAFVTSCCLRKPNLWSSLESFNIEYLRIEEPKTFSKMFSAALGGGAISVPTSCVLHGLASRSHYANAVQKSYATRIHRQLALRTLPQDSHSYDTDSRRLHASLFTPQSLFLLSPFSASARYNILHTG